MGGRPAAPIGSRTQRKGIVGVEHDSVLVENRPISYVSAPHSCRVHGKNKIGKGCRTVHVYGKPLARVTDKATCGCKIVSQFAPTVLVGEQRPFFGNSNVIQDVKDWWSGVGLYGKGIRIVGSKAFIAQIRSELDQIKSLPTGRKILEQIDDPTLRKRGRITIIEEPAACEYALPLPFTVPPQVSSVRDVLKPLRSMPKAEREAAWERVGNQTAPAEVTPGPDAADQLIVTKPGPGVPAEQILVGGAPRCQFVCTRDAGGTALRVPRYLHLGHELIHVVHFMAGRNLQQFYDPRELKSNLEEAQTMGTGAYAGTPMTENAMRDEIGVANRSGHDTVCPAGSTMKRIRPPNAPGPSPPRG